MVTTFLNVHRILFFSSFFQVFFKKKAISGAKDRIIAMILALQLAKNYPYVILLLIQYVLI